MFWYFNQKFRFFFKQVCMFFCSIFMKFCRMVYLKKLPDVREILQKKTNFVEIRISLLEILKNPTTRSGNFHKCPDLMKKFISSIHCFDPTLSIHTRRRRISVSFRHENDYNGEKTENKRKIKMRYRVIHYCIVQSNVHTPCCCCCC